MGDFQEGRVVIEIMFQKHDRHNLIDLTVGIFMHMAGYYDHAISIAGKILQQDLAYEPEMLVFTLSRLHRME